MLEGLKDLVAKNRFNQSEVVAYWTHVQSRSSRRPVQRLRFCAGIDVPLAVLRRVQAAWGDCKLEVRPLRQPSSD